MQRLWFAKAVGVVNSRSPFRTTAVRRLGFVVGAAFVLMVLSASSLYSPRLPSPSAVLGLVVRYGQTGGIKGRLNEVGDTINGVNICPEVNDNDNNVPGCDMSDDPGFNDNGTPGDGTDDFYTGDLIVRTNDAFTVTVDYNVIGSDDGVTLTGELPDGFVFDILPGFCETPGSSISDDGRTITCYLGEKANESASLDFLVRVESDVPNGTEPGLITFTAEGENSPTVSDDTNESIIVTAAPRWNLRKSAISKLAYTKTASDGTTAYPEGTPGWRVTYKYYIEVWDDQTDDTLNPLLGNESLGEDATVTFVDALGNLYENASNDGTIGAELMQCYIGGNGFDPYPYLTDDPDHPERTITDSGEITCSQAGGVGTDVAITVSGADLTLNHYPTESRTGGVILGGDGRYMAAIGAVVVFIPADAARDTSDGILHLNNCMTDFDPESVTGLSNFGDEVENTADNCRTDTFKLYDASFGKAFADSADPPKGYAYVGEGPGEVSYYHAGDGWISPGQEFAAAAYYRNDGGVETHDAAICDVLDAATYDVVDLEGQPGNAVNLLVVHGSYDLSQVQVEYATGYVTSTWPPSPPTGQAVVDECADPSVTWYSTTTEALANDPNGYPITKIRVTFLDPVPPGTEVRAYIRTKARDTYAETGALPPGVTAGDPIPNGTVLPNFMTATDDGELDGDWHVGDYDPKTTMDEPDEGGRGDRVGLTRAFVRVSKETGNNDEIDSVTLGQQFEFVLKPELITYGEPMATQVTVTDVLPPGLSYVNGSATQGGVSITPTVTACTGAGTPHAACTQSGETVLEWTLDDQMPNEEITPIVFLAEVGLDNADGDVLDNKVIVSSPADSTPEEDRIAHRSVVVAVPNELVATKSVDRIRREVQDTGPYQWQVNFKNTTPNDLTHLDVIDVLPYNGDTTNPLGSEALARTPPSDFHGVLNFVAVNFADYSDDAQPCGTGGAEATYYFTNVSPDSVNLDPKDPSNTLGAGTIWCEGTADGPGAACGFSNEEVTAVRARSNNTLESGGACRLILETSPAADADGQWHLEGDIYTNTAGATADQLSLPVATNSVSVTIYASSLGDFVWEDTNGNGIQDPGEEGIAGVRLSLLDADGNPVDDPEHPGTPYTVVTDSTGHYTFTNLPAGDYQIEIDADTLPANHGPTAQDQGSDDTLDSDVDANNIINATLPEDTDVDYYDAGYYPYRAIGDTVFYDQNHNGLPDPGEGMEGVRVILTPPPDVDLGNGPGNPIETTTDANGNYLFENLPAGDYTVTVDESTFPSDLAWLQGHNTVDPDGGNDSTSQVTLSREEDRLDQDFGYWSEADLSLSKSVSPANAGPDEEVTFTLVVTNAGPDEATHVEVTDHLPDGYTFVSAAPDTGSYDSATGVWTIDRIANGETATLTITARVNATGDYENTAEVTAADQPDPDSTPGNGDPDEDDYATASIVYEPAADLAITKDDGVVLTAGGATVTYTIVVTNNGPNDAMGATVTDAKPAAIASWTWACDSATGGASGCDGVTDSTDDFSDTVNLPSGSSITYKVTAQVADDASGTLENTVEVAVPSGVTDPNTDDNTATDVDDLAETEKTLSDTNQDFTADESVAIGEILTYETSLTIPPGQVVNLTLTDVMDRGLAFVACESITASGTLTSTAGSLDEVCANPVVRAEPPDSTAAEDQGRNVKWNFGTVENATDDNVTLTVRYQVVVLDNTGNQSGTSLANEATWAWEGGEASDSADPVVVVEPDLEIQKSASPTTVLPGEPVTFTLTIQHTGDSETPAYDVEVTDKLPAGLTYVSGSLTAVDGPTPTSMSYNGTTRTIQVVWDTFDLGAVSHIQFQAVVSQSAKGGLTNTASVAWSSLPGDVSDPQSPYNTLSTERAYDPLSPADVYQALASVQIRVLLPETGFAPGRVTAVPEQKVAYQHTAVELEIPKLGVDVPVVGVPRTAEGWDLTWLWDQAGWLEGSAYPTWPGNTVITGHVYLPDGEPGPFVDLRKLMWGDKVILHANGKRYEYEVRVVQVVQPDDVRLLGHKDRDWVTLITCQGYDEESGTYRWRLIVQAVLVRVTPEG